MSHEDNIRRGEHAKRVLEDELVKEALAETRTAITEQWMALSVTDKAQAEELKRLLWASQQFENIFTSLIAGAEISKQELLMQSNMEIKRDAAKGRLYG